VKRKRGRLGKAFLSTGVLVVSLLLGFVLRGRIGLRLAIVVAAGALILGLHLVERRYRDPWR
jgi:hypothetical protein